MGTDALVFCILMFPFLSLFLGIFISSLRVLMVRLRVQTMQPDMPVGSGVSTCSPFHNVHSFHTVARALHTQETHRNTHNDGGDALRESRFSAYLNIALNNRSREGWADGEGRK